MALVLNNKKWTTGACHSTHMNLSTVYFNLETDEK